MCLCCIQTINVSFGQLQDKYLPIFQVFPIHFIKILNIENSDFAYTKLSFWDGNVLYFKKIKSCYAVVAQIKNVILTSERAKQCAPYIIV